MQGAPQTSTVRCTTTAPMKTKIGIVLVLAGWSALDQMTQPDFVRLDWADVVVVPLIIFALLLLIPNRLFERRKGSGS
jgi:membrane protein DedA with SNARE-associated domain